MAMIRSSSWFLLSCIAPALPAQGFIAMTATQVPQANAPAGVADVGIASRADGAWLVFGGEQANGLLAGTFVVNNSVWQQRVSVLNPAFRSGHQLAFDPVRLDCVMFGGKDALGNTLGDTWVFANDQWSYRQTPSPSARSGHRMCFDAARGVVMLFGGKDAAQTLLGDTWMWNGTAWAQVATAVAPAARHEHGIAFDAYRQKVVLFGGEATNGLRSDVWDWDGASWVEIVPPLVNGLPFGPDARKQHGMAFDAIAERVVVFGGDRGGNGVGNDTWVFDGANWFGLLPGIAHPAARARCGIAANASGRLRVLSGVSAGSYSNDVWELNVPVVPRASEYGAACVGSGGPLQLQLNAGTRATVGSTLGMRLTGMTYPFAVGFGFAGFSRSSVSGIPLPVDLAAVGIPGCNAYNSADINFGLGLPSGSPLATAWDVAIPNSAQFVGLDVFFQAVALEPFGYFRFATASNGIAVRIGDDVSILPPERSVTEDFDSELFLDPIASAASCSGGFLQFAQIGGDGSHGPFSLSLATQLASQGSYRVFELNTNNTLIPAANTTSGTSVFVNDGIFQFTEMVLPADVKLVFAGTAVPQISVRGRLQVDGVVDVSGQSRPYFESSNLSSLPGQLGGLGGIGGANGGSGGSRCVGSGAIPANAGQNGVDARVPAAHAYAAQVVGTGGRGSGVFPASGLRTALVFPPPSASTDYVLQTTAGGGGGGFVFAGADGRAVSNQADPSGNGATRLDFLGPNAVGGTSFSIFAVPAQALSSRHFLVGGSGGGGGGSHAALMTKALAQAPTGNWAAGCGGGGGGGVVALRAGRELRVSSTGSLLATGGSAGVSPVTQVAIAQSAPGGGGSGGSILLQSGGTVQVSGLVDVRGGAGGRLARGTLPTPPPRGGQVVVEGGSGSSGVLRLEAPGAPGVALLPNAQPPAASYNVSALTEQDRRVGFVSKFYSTGNTGPSSSVIYVRYEIYARIQGQAVLFSDDPAVGIPARLGFGPIEAWWQGVRVDPVTGVVDPTDTPGPWRRAVGVGVDTLSVDARNGFRMQLVLDRSNIADVQIDRVRVVFRG
jgi:hypothetical protein